GFTLNQIRELPRYVFPDAKPDQIIGEWLMENEIVTLYRNGPRKMIRFAQLSGEVRDEYEVTENNGKYFDLDEIEMYFVPQENGSLKMYDEYFQDSTESISLEQYIADTETLRKTNRRMR
ncbi:MAG: hypothetical protein AB8B56_01975, partial [Crocinitomicaceae bacterium]